MPENNKTEEFLKKLAPCIERGELEACAEEAARVAREMDVGAEELLDLSRQEGMEGKNDFAYVLALAAAQGLKGEAKAGAYCNAGIASHDAGNIEKAEDYYRKAIEANPKLEAVHSNYASLLSECNRKNEAEDHYRKAIEANPKYAMAHYNYACLLSECNRKAEAEDQYRKAIEANPKFAAAHCNYASLLSECNKKNEAEDHYRKAIEANPKDADAHYNYANLLKELDRINEAEDHYRKAIEANPKDAAAHSNYALLLFKLDRKNEAEDHYRKAIEDNPKLAEAHSNYAILLKELDRKNEAEDHYRKAIEANPKSAATHSNYANLLSELDRKAEAEKHYQKAIEANPKSAEVHSHYAILLEELGRKAEAEEHYKQSIAANPMYANAHGAYGLLLIELDRRKEAWKETEKASNIYMEIGQFTTSHFVKAWFYERCSEKKFNRKKFRESGEDAEKAGEEYLRASETTKGDLKDASALQGNVLKAKSFVRKIPEKSWYRKILNRFGKNPDISELMGNLSEAAKYYEKASCCSAGDRKDICNACFSSIRVFSEILFAMSALIKNDDAEIDKDKWLSSLELAHKIYTDKNLINGAALVDTLKQLIKCVDELAEHRKMGLHIQEERLGKCYNNLIEVSEKLDGALKIIAEHSVEAIRDYAKKQGMGFVKEENPSISLWDNPSIKALLTILTIIAAIIAILQFIKHDTQALEYLKSVFFNSSTP